MKEKPESSYKMTSVDFPPFNNIYNVETARLGIVHVSPAAYTYVLSYT